jgi:hypothetical protein
MQHALGSMEHFPPVGLVGRQEGDAVDAILVPPCHPDGLPAKLYLCVSCARVRLCEALLTRVRQRWSAAQMSKAREVIIDATS